MKDKVEGQAMTREDMKEFLWHFRTANEGIKILEERRRRIAGELRALGSSATAVAEIEARLEAQRRERAVAALQVLDLIGLLPLGSVERTVVELRHIDGLQWCQIAAEVYLSRSNTFCRYNAALDLLLAHERTRRLIFSTTSSEE